MRFLWEFIGTGAWVLFTLAVIYLIAFWFDRHLLRLGWQAVMLMMLTLLVIVGTVDWLLILDNLSENLRFTATCFHLTLMMIVSIKHQTLQEYIGYPFKR